MKSDETGHQVKSAGKRTRRACDSCRVSKVKVIASSKVNTVAFNKILTV